MRVFVFLLVLSVAYPVFLLSPLIELYQRIGIYHGKWKKTVGGLPFTDVLAIGILLE